MALTQADRKVRRRVVIARMDIMLKIIGLNVT